MYLAHNMNMIIFWYLVLILAHFRHFRLNQLMTIIHYTCTVAYSQNV